MPAVFTGRWTRGQILGLALQKAGNRKILHLARDRLNRLLEELYTQWEWPFLYREYLLTLPAGNQGGPSFYATFTLPADFLKTESETTGLRIISKDGHVVDLPLIEVDPIQFRRRAVPHDLQQERPLLWYVDYADRVGVLWPAPIAACSASLFYKFLPADLPIGSGTDAPTAAYDADVPLFPWGGYLAMAMELWSREYDHDPQAQTLAMDVQAALDNIRQIAMPRHSQEMTVPLDPQIFGPGFRDEASRYFRDWDWW